MNHTRKEVAKRKNCALDFIDFTTEVEDEYEDKYMPTLDMKVRLDQKSGLVTYRYYQKQWQIIYV